MSRSISPEHLIVWQGIPFTAAFAAIRETHGAKKTLPMRLPIPGALRNPQKQRNLQRHKKMHTDWRLGVTRPAAHLPKSPKRVATAAASPTRAPRGKVLKENFMRQAVMSRRIGVCVAYPRLSRLALS